MPGLRVVLDTNVLVSGIAYPEGIPGRIIATLKQRALEVVVSRYILDEVARVLPRMRGRMSQAEVREVMDTFLFLVQIVEPDADEETGLRDPADQKVLTTFRKARADYLITGDKDLLALGDAYPIITPAAFWARHG